jgi:hypothetical protein
VGAASVGYTDNVQSSPDPPVPGVPEKTGDAFLALEPGVVIASTTTGAVHRLSYIYTANLFLSETDGNSSSNRLDYTLFSRSGAALHALARRERAAIPPQYRRPLAHRFVDSNRRRPARHDGIRAVPR